MHAENLRAKIIIQRDSVMQEKIWFYEKMERTCDSISNLYRANKITFDSLRVANSFIQQQYKEKDLIYEKRISELDNKLWRAKFTNKVLSFGGGAVTLTLIGLLIFKK